MVKRITFIMAAVLLIAVSALFCTIAKEEAAVTDDYTADTIQSDTAPLPNTYNVSEDAVFDRVITVSTADVTNLGQYEEIKTVDPSEFEFGEYLPVVSFDTLSTPKGGYYTDYAVLGDHSLEECTKCLHRLTDTYGADILTELTQMQTDTMITSEHTDEKKTDLFYLEYAHNSYTSLNSNGLHIEETEPCNFEITASDGSYYRMCIDKPRGYRMQIEQVINGRYFLISVFRLSHDSYTDIRNFGVYLYDIENDASVFLEKYTINPSLSPDMKYLIYTGQASKQKGNSFSGLNQLNGQDRGFYIKNLESSETAFYSYPNPGDFADYGCVNWISKEEYTKLITQTPSNVSLDATTQKFFENTREFPKNEEALKTVHISFPEDFPMETYKKPVSVSPENFDFGDYMLNVTFAVGNITASDHVYTNSFLGDGIGDIDEGRELFDRFNEKYMIKHPVENYYYDNSLVTPNSFLGNYLYNSRVTYISPDGRLVITKSLVDTKEKDSVVDSWYSYDGWMERTDYYTDGRHTASELSDSYFWGYSKGTANLPNYSTSGDYTGDYEYFGNGDLYSHSQNRKVYHLILPNKYVKNDDGSILSLACNINQIIDDRYLLLDMQKSFPGSTTDNATYSHCSYLYDLETGEYTYLGSYLFEATISPDGRYLGYMTYWWDYIPNISENDLYEMQDGYYILDLESKKTVFYSNEKYGYKEISGWVSKNAINSAIAHSGSFVDPDTEQREDMPLLKSTKNTKKAVLDIDPRRSVTDALQWVNSSEFSFGKYIPFIEYKDNYSFMPNTEDENTLYQALSVKLRMDEHKNSQIIFVSDDGDKFGIYTYTEDGIPDRYQLISSDWKTEFEVSSLVHYYLKDSKIFNGESPKGYVPPEHANYYSLDFADDAVLYTEYGDNSDRVYIYNGEDSEPVYEVVLPKSVEYGDDGIKKLSHSYIESCSLEGYVIIRTSTTSIEFWSNDNVINAYYFADLNKGTVIPIDQNIHYMKVSPDGKNVFGYMYEKDKTSSVFINVEDKTYTKYSSMDLINWVNKENILSFTK